MAKRELSNTLKNLKFMQRASPANKVEDKDPNPTQTSTETSSPSTFGLAPAKRCIVIMEGDPHPGASRGRMSFQKFNPSIDKLNEEATKDDDKQASSSSVEGYNDKTFERGDGVSLTKSVDSNMETTGNESDVDLKRKQPESDRDRRTPHKLPKHASGNEGQSSSHNKKKGPYNQQKNEKLDWNILRPPKAK